MERARIMKHISRNPLHAASPNMNYQTIAAKVDHGITWKRSFPTSIAGIPRIPSKDPQP
ncbi:uncharacterized protein BDZ83DRAFT_624932 [Colletotrichum acutatum]|uniref:Uncharacterized protein n=1 Tax=Glomerella acutata TaxID=27357 RepID=A0AAD8ULC0_GLOAC|nr:uncharacterized protein BDZ83DRAFT_624932 [Colletotrichum acutatum]KAK1723859.1 hypothetical protein BDZ83DRAFT_624932 [Colletotrichum acutatum]